MLWLESGRTWRAVKEHVGRPNSVYIGEIADDLTLAAGVQKCPADKVARHCGGRDLLGFYPRPLPSLHGAANAAQMRSQSENPTVHDAFVRLHRDLLVLGSRQDRVGNPRLGRVSAASESPGCSVTTEGLNKG